VIPKVARPRIAKIRPFSKQNKTCLYCLAGFTRAQAANQLPKKHALAAYKWAWADGEPYVHRYELNKARALLETLGVPIPNLPPYDPAKDEKLPWEDDVAAAIAELRRQQESDADPSH
jgi:hypothetical protein